MLDLESIAVIHIQTIGYWICHHVADSESWVLNLSPLVIFRILDLESITIIHMHNIGSRTYSHSSSEYWILIIWSLFLASLISWSLHLDHWFLKLAFCECWILNIESCIQYSVNLPRPSTRTLRSGSQDPDRTILHSLYLKYARTSARSAFWMFEFP